MTESASGIILRTRPLTETSLIVHWLTPEFGRIATVARGARRPKSPFAGKLDLFYTADFSLNRSRHSGLHALREVNLRQTHTAIRADMVKLQQAAYAAALVEQTTETETPLAEIHDLLAGLLDFLCRQESSPQTVFAFELKLLHLLGLSPDLAAARLSAGTKKIAENLTHKNWAANRRLKLTAAQTVELRQFLHVFLLSHLGRLAVGRAAAVAGAV